MTPQSPLRAKEAMDYMFYPRTIAIIGASANPAKPGGAPLISLINSGYAGNIYPVNSKYAELAGLSCYSSVLDIPGEVDLAIIAVAAPTARQILQECADKKVKAAIMFTSGFAETGESGARFQADITKLAETNGISLCGPNCMGVFNSQNKMTAGFVISQAAEQLTAPASFGFISQSGGFGAVIHAAAADRGIGFTYFISSGNESDLQFADYLAYLAEDPATKIIGGYIEGIKDGRKLMQAADMALAAQKPVIVIKAGGHPAAAKAAASHTGALAGDPRVYQALFQQKGLIRADGVEELAAILTVLTAGNLPAGNRIGLIAGSGGNGVLLADKCEEVGLEVAPLTAPTREALNKLLPPFVTAANPIDMTAKVLSDAGLLRKTIDLVLQDPHMDMIIIMHWTTDTGSTQPTREVIDLLADAAKPVMVLVWGSDEAAWEDLRFFRARRIAAVREIDFAARSMAALAKYSAKLSARKNHPPILPGRPPDRSKTAALLKDYPSGSILSESQAKAVLRSWGIETTREALATTPEEAVDIAAQFTCPAVLKVDSPDIPHKTDVGGVKLGLETPGQIREAYREIEQNVRRHRPDALIKGILVQEMLTGGVEAIAGFSRDPVFGPVVLFGLGGVWVEALEDVSLRIAPLSYWDAGEMYEEIKGSRVLSGIRGRPPGDREAVIEILIKLSQLALDFPEIDEIDLNPLFVFPQGQGARAADVLLTIK